MAEIPGQERRQFTRLRVEVPLRYKFLSTYMKDSRLDQIYEGITKNISGGGLLLYGTIHDLDWIPDLLTRKMLMGVILSLPDQEEPSKALARVAWIETVDEKTHRCNIGLEFKEITAEDKDKIFLFVIRSQLPS